MNRNKEFDSEHYIQNPFKCFGFVFFSSSMAKSILDLFQFKDCFVCMTVCSNVERLTKTTWRRCLAGGGGDGNDSDVRSRGTVVGEEGEP